MPRSRKDAGLRREEILSGTVDQIRLHGLHAVRMADVADFLGVSTALIVYHFRTRDTLIAEAFSWAAQQDLETLDKLSAGPLTARERLDTAIEWYSPTGEADGWTLWIDAWAAALRDPTLRQIGHELDLRWKDALTQIIKDGVEAREFEVADPRASAWRITALLDGFAVQTIVHRGLPSRPQASSWVADFVNRELRTG